jgi:hypothetical protein
LVVVAELAAQPDLVMVLPMLMKTHLNLMMMLKMPMSMKLHLNLMLMGNLSSSIVNLDFRSHQHH